MPEEAAVGCARPTGGPVGEEPDNKSTDEEQTRKELVTTHGTGATGLSVLLPF